MKKMPKPPNKQAKILAELIDKKIDSRVSRMEANMAKMLRLFKRLKSTASPMKIQKLEKEIQSLKEILEDFNVKSLEEDIFKHFNEINKKVSESIDKDRESLANMEIELAALKRKLGDAEGIEDELHGLDVKSIRKDIESLKTKAHWVELEMEKIHIRPLIDRIDELEARVNAFKLSQPMVIE
jgi:uncharacterized protein YukE